MGKCISLFKCHFLIVFHPLNSTVQMLLLHVCFMSRSPPIFFSHFHFFLYIFHSNETWHTKRPLFLQIRLLFKLPKSSFQPGMKLLRQLTCLRLKMCLSDLPDQTLNMSLCQWIWDIHFWLGSLHLRLSGWVKTRILWIQCWKDLLEDSVADRFPKR